MSYYSSHVALAQIVEPSLVQARCVAQGMSEPEAGMIWVTIPEIGFSGDMMIPCRYGLSIPFIKVQQNAKLWVEPTVGDRERWKYTGFADCGGSITPDSTMQLLLEWATQVIYATTNGTMHLSAEDADEPFVLGNTFKTELDKHYDLINTLVTTLNGWTATPNDGGASLKTALTAAGFFALPMPDYSQILSTKIFGE